jgi:hypothetical protein
MSTNISIQLCISEIAFNASSNSNKFVDYVLEEGCLGETVLSAPSFFAWHFLTFSLDFFMEMAARSTSEGHLSVVLKLLLKLSLHQQFLFAIDDVFTVLDIVRKISSKKFEGCHSELLMLLLVVATHPKAVEIGTELLMLVTPSIKSTLPEISSLAIHCWRTVLRGNSFLQLAFYLSRFLTFPSSCPFRTSPGSSRRLSFSCTLRNSLQLDVCRNLRPPKPGPGQGMPSISFVFLYAYCFFQESLVSASVACFLEEYQIGVLCPQIETACRELLVPYIQVRRDWNMFDNWRSNSNKPQTLIRDSSELENFWMLFICILRKSTGFAVYLGLNSPSLTSLFVHPVTSSNSYIFPT